MLALMLGEAPEKVHIHYVEESADRLRQLQQIEIDRRSPLDADDPAFQALGIKWISEPGSHYFIEGKSGQIVSAIKIS